MALAYLVIRSFISDSAGFAQSRHITTKLYESYGGHFLVRSDELRTLDGARADFALTVAEFPSMAVVERLLFSPESAALQQDAKRKAALDIWAMPGVEVPESAAPAAGPRAYVLCRIPDGDPKQAEAARALLASAVASRVGRYLVASNVVRVATGSPVVAELLLVEFPSMEHLHEALGSAALRTEDLVTGRKGFDIWVAPGMELF